MWRMPLKNKRAPLLCYFKLFASFRNHWWIQTWDTVRKLSIWVPIKDLFSRVTLQIDRWPWKNGASLVCYFKRCASFCSYWWLQTGVTVRERLIWVKISDYFSRVTLQFDGWPWKTIGYLFEAASSFVHHFSAAICLFKLELRSGNGYVGSWPLWPWPLPWTLTSCMYQIWHW